MAELVTVYRTLASDVSRVVGYLRSRNLNPVVLDDTAAVGAYRSQAREIRIAVPQTERDTACAVLAELEKQGQARLSPAVKVANRVVLLVIVVLAFVGLVGLLDRGGKWFLATWLVVTAVVAVALVRQTWRKHPKR
jgi:lysylphosphatidylglycerol synthetase-like protein (DUF2156 family)